MNKKEILIIEYLAKFEKLTNKDNRPYEKSEEAPLSVHGFVRSKTRVVKLSKFSPEKIQEFHKASALAYIIFGVIFYRAIMQD